MATAITVPGCLPVLPHRLRQEDDRSGQRQSKTDRRDQDVSLLREQTERQQDARDGPKIGWLAVPLSLSRRQQLTTNPAAENVVSDRAKIPKTRPTASPRWNSGDSLLLSEPIRLHQISDHAIP
ncbi:hypothetical protein BKA56DRAFT_323899 [Ilyonectria sp. MPI-CAGE-AT-0026]|nr:hypothetical protein BKA56DRAFT_323899 [Ilyonectria sp. MPI-CAGE-AT-0026]